MTGSEESFVGTTLWQEKVTLVDGRTVMSKGRGQGRTIGRGLDGTSIDMNLKELLYVPELPGSVLSISRFTDEGYSVMFGSTSSYKSVAQKYFTNNDPEVVSENPLAMLLNFKMYLL